MDLLGAYQLYQKEFHLELVWKTFGIIFDIFQDDTIDILQLANYLRIPTCLCLLECINSYNLKKTV